MPVCVPLFDIAVQKHRHSSETPGKRRTNSKVELFGWLRMHVIFVSVPLLKPTLMFKFFVEFSVGRSSTFSDEFLVRFEVVGSPGKMLGMV
jgi:hypothetical protein